MDSPARAARRRRRLPERGTGHPGHVDAVQEHRELGPVERRGAATRCDRWDPKFALLKTFVDHKKTAAVPHQDLRAVRPLADEGKQVAAEGIEVPALDDREQAVMTASHVHTLRR